MESHNLKVVRKKPTEKKNAFFEKDTPHGLVKRIIWKKYLQAYIRIMQQARRTKTTGYRIIVYDLCAGKGVYEKKWPEEIEGYGSPLIALRVAIDYFIWKRKLPNTFDAQSNYEEFITGNIPPCPIELVFFEKESLICRRLFQNVKKMFSRYKIPICIQGECIASSNESIQIKCTIKNCRFEKVKLPELSDDEAMVTFLDVFGHNKVPPESISEFIDKRKNLFLNLTAPFMEKLSKDKREAICEFVPVPLDGNLTWNEIVDFYVSEVQRITQLNHEVLKFEMKGKKDTQDLLYYLVFFSCQQEDIKSMKEAMKPASLAGDDLYFSDYDFLYENDSVLDMSNKQNVESVAQSIFNEFKGKRNVSLREIKKFVDSKTNYVFRKTPLKILQERQKIYYISNQYGEEQKTAGQFPDINQLRKKKIDAEDPKMKKMYPYKYKCKTENIWEMSFVDEWTIQLIRILEFFFTVPTNYYQMISEK